MQRWMMALALAGCAKTTTLPTLAGAVDSELATVWVVAGELGELPDDVGAVVWLADRADESPGVPVCHATHRGGPPWQQLDVAGTRFVCLADPAGLTRRQRLEQRFQAPAAVGAVAGMELILVSGSDESTVVMDDLMAFSDALALRIVIQLGDATDVRVVDEWAPLVVVVGRDEPVTVRISDGSLAVEGGGRKVRSDAGGAWHTP